MLLQAVSLKITRIFNDLTEENAKSRRRQDGDPRHGILSSCVGNSFPNHHQLYEVAQNFKELAEYGGREVFSNNLCASLFYKGFFIEPNFGRVHLAGQYV
jgi:hypothetical protein